MIWSQVDLKEGTIFAQFFAATIMHQYPPPKGVLAESNTGALTHGVRPYENRCMDPVWFQTWPTLPRRVYFGPASISSMRISTFACSACVPHHSDWRASSDKTVQDQGHITSKCDRQAEIRAALPTRNMHLSCWSFLLRLFLPVVCHLSAAVILSS